MRSINTNAFALIEMLVVIAIIALLVSIVMPSLKRAKDLARMTVCWSNARSIAMGMNIYACDSHNGRLPPSTPHRGHSLIAEEMAPSGLFACPDDNRGFGDAHKMSYGMKLYLCCVARGGPRSTETSV